MKLYYSGLLITVALLVASPALAEDGRDGRIPPPPPQHPMMATTTPDGRPLPGRQNMGSTTNPGIGWGDRRGEHRDIMASSTERIGTSTPPKAVLRGMFNQMMNFFGKGEKEHETSTPAREDNEASSTPSQPPQAVIQFLQNFFGRFFH